MNENAMREFWGARLETDAREICWIFSKFYEKIWMKVIKNFDKWLKWCSSDDQKIPKNQMISNSDLDLKNFKWFSSCILMI